MSEQTRPRLQDENKEMEVLANIVAACTSGLHHEDVIADDTDFKMARAIHKIINATIDTDAGVSHGDGRVVVPAPMGTVESIWVQQTRPLLPGA